MQIFYSFCHFPEQHHDEKGGMDIEEGYVYAYIYGTITTRNGCNDFVMSSVVGHKLGWKSTGRRSKDDHKDLAGRAG